MDTASAVLEAVRALREARHGDGPVLSDPAIVQALLDVIPAECASLNDLEIEARQSAALDLVEYEPDDNDAAFWEHFWDSLTCSYTERIARLRSEVMTTSDFYTDRQWHSTGMYSECMRPGGVDKELVIPLPAPRGIARRLVFFRGPGLSFSAEECVAATLLQAHISEALRQHARAASARLLTARQFGLLQLVAAGHDNRTIARQLAISPGTVRVHLENIYERLGVMSRTAAVARTFPDTTWL
jgi:DNA-binding CsgD family transcriptional regulator